MMLKQILKAITSMKASIYAHILQWNLKTEQSEPRHVLTEIS